MRTVLAAVAMLTLAACSGSGIVKVKDPGVVKEVTTTTAIDFGQVGLKGVSSRTTTSIALGPGGASLAGTVTGPDGPVDAATVHVERLVGSSIATMDVPTNPDGTWSLPKVLGGRYRIRTWKTPELALTKPEQFYLQSSETKAVNLRVDRYSGPAVTASIAPNPPVVNEPANLYVLLVQRSVDAGGVVRNVPAVGAAIHLVGTGFQLETPSETVTDGNGIAHWGARCTTTNQTSLSVTGPAGGSLPLTVPACVPEGTPPTTVGTTTTTVRSGRTTTTRRGA